MNPTPPALGDLIYEARALRRISQDGLAEATGVSRPAISMWERGARNSKGVIVVPMLGKVLKVTRYLDIPDEKAIRAVNRLRLQAANEKNQLLPDDL